MQQNGWYGLRIQFGTEEETKELAFRTRQALSVEPIIGPSFIVDFEKCLEIWILFCPVNKQAAYKSIVDATRILSNNRVAGLLRRKVDNVQNTEDISFSIVESKHRKVEKLSPLESAFVSLIPEYVEYEQHGDSITYEDHYWYTCQPTGAGEITATIATSQGYLPVFYRFAMETLLEIASQLPGKAEYSDAEIRVAIKLLIEKYV